MANIKKGKSRGAATPTAFVRINWINSRGNYEHEPTEFQ